MTFTVKPREQMPPSSKLVEVRRVLEAIRDACHDPKTDLTFIRNIAVVAIRRLRDE
jgi:hypothetical protein